MSMRTNAWRATLFYALFSNALFLMGCAKVGPDFVLPEAAVSPNWMEAGDPRVKRGSSAEYRDWWQVFDDRALNGLIDQAYRENLPVKIAGLR